jgi:energy-coupling factor transporter ATP-binding protein EcfA2
MDEPTSGLDTRAAAIVLRAVRNTMDTERTIVYTISMKTCYGKISMKREDINALRLLH